MIGGYLSRSTLWCIMFVFGWTQAQRQLLSLHTLLHVVLSTSCTLHPAILLIGRYARKHFHRSSRLREKLSSFRSLVKLLSVPQWGIQSRRLRKPLTCTITMLERCQWRCFRREEWDKIWTLRQHILNSLVRTHMYICFVWLSYRKNLVVFP